MAHVGSVGSYAGDGISGNRDPAENGMPNDSNFNYDSWSGSNTGDYVVTMAKFTKLPTPQYLNQVSRK